MAWNAGDEAASITALEELYRRRYQRFLRVAIALLGSRELATDAVQEAFARAIRTRFDFRAEASLETWVWRTLTNVCLDERRRRSFERELADSTARNLAGKLYTSGGAMGFTTANGFFIAIRASGEQLVLAAAHDLQSAG